MASRTAPNPAAQTASITAQSRARAATAHGRSLRFAFDDAARCGCAGRRARRESRCALLGAACAHRQRATTRGRTSRLPQAQHRDLRAGSPGGCPRRRAIGAAWSPAGRRTMRSGEGIGHRPSVVRFLTSLRAPQNGRASASRGSGDWLNTVRASSPLGRQDRGTSRARALGC